MAVEFAFVIFERGALVIDVGCEVEVMVDRKG